MNKSNIWTGQSERSGTFCDPSKFCEEQNISTLVPHMKNESTDIDPPLVVQTTTARRVGGGGDNGCNKDA